jgi:redox-sensing transcriptional repressor
MLQSPLPDSASDRLTVGVAARLSRYLQVLTQAKKMGKERISSQEIADYTNINATQIRRDLSNFGKFGKRGVGYSIDSLLSEIRKILRTQGQHNIALVGAGRLGQAIASSPIFAEHGINIAAVFDSSPTMIGADIGGINVEDERRLKDAVRDKNIVVGVLAVPATAAQKVADDLVDAGVRIIFNYSEALLDVPAEVTVHTSNPAVELLHALYFHLAEARPRPCGSSSGTATCSGARGRTSTRVRSPASGAGPGTTWSSSARSGRPGSTTWAARAWWTSSFREACCRSSCWTATRVSSRSSCRTSRPPSGRRTSMRTPAPCASCCLPTSCSRTTCSWAVPSARLPVCPFG